MSCSKDGMQCWQGLLRKCSLVPVLLAQTQSVTSYEVLDVKFVASELLQSFRCSFRWFLRTLRNACSLRVRTGGFEEIWILLTDSIMDIITEYGQGVI